MNDLLRPSSRHWQDIQAVTPRQGLQHWDIVGPICETGDFLGKDRDLALFEEDLLAVMGVTPTASRWRPTTTRPRAAR